MYQLNLPFGNKVVLYIGDDRYIWNGKYVPHIFRKPLQYRIDSIFMNQTSAYDKGPGFLEYSLYHKYTDELNITHCKYKQIGFNI